MKQALVILDANLCGKGHLPGFDYEFVANVHDEFQIETRKDLAHEVGQAAVKAIVAAGEHFKFKCPLAGNYSVGPNWCATH
jgi:DNA polymerase-1